MLFFRIFKLPDDAEQSILLYIWNMDTIEIISNCIKQYRVARSRKYH